MSELEVMVTSWDLRPLGLVRSCSWVPGGMQGVETCTGVLATGLKLCFDLLCIFWTGISYLSLPIKGNSWYPFLSCGINRLSLLQDKLIFLV